MCGIYSILQGFDDIDSVGDNRSAAWKISAHTMMTIIGGVKLAEMKIVFVEKLKSYRFYDDGLMKLIRYDICSKYLYESRSTVSPSNYIASFMHASRMEVFPMKTSKIKPSSSH